MKLSKQLQRDMTNFVLGLIKGVQHACDVPDEALEDHWVAWSDDYDINIFVDEETDTYKASVYRVVGGSTKCDDWFVLNISPRATTVEWDTSDTTYQQEGHSAYNQA